MDKLRRKIKQYFEDPSDPIIDKFSRSDLEYLDEYMKHPISDEKIQQVKVDSERIVINHGNDEGITYLKKIVNDFEPEILS
ncbi:MAG: hypothetical protein KAS71_08250 [Bacteroidales bacterium]|nr:hypothetical protein [Bacteroidales bacterium]